MLDISLGGCRESILKLSSRLPKVSVLVMKFLSVRYEQNIMHLIHMLVPFGSNHACSCSVLAAMLAFIVVLILILFLILLLILMLIYILRKQTLSCCRQEHQVSNITQTCSHDTM